MTELSAAQREIVDKVIKEIHDALIALGERGESHVIDLRRLPHMSEASYAYLKDALRAGEVTAQVSAEAQVEIAEMGFPGVWWLTYRRMSGEIATEVIEIALVPKILVTSKAQVNAGARRLAARDATETVGG